MSETVQTPIGLLPSDWAYKEIGPHVEMTTGPAFDSTRFGDDPVGVRLARGINITKGHFRWSADITKYWPKVTPDIEKYLLCANDVIIGMDGSLVGRNYALATPGDVPSLLVQRVARLRTDKYLDCRFLYYFIASDFWLSHVDVVKTHSGIPHISNGDIREFRIAYPSTAEQRKIARILTTVDNLIEKTEALIAKYQAIKQGMMHDLFTRGVDSRGHLRPPYEEAPELYKQSELGWIPKEWEVVPLSSVAEVGRGKFTPRPRNDPKYYGGTYPFIQTGDVANSLGRYLSTYTQTLNELGTTVSKGFPAGTIAVTIAANIADTAILGIPMFLPDSIVGVVVHPDTNIRYVELCLRRAKHALDAKAPQSAQKNINLDDLRPLPIPLPQQIEQERTAKLYESNEALLTAEETNLQKLRLQKTGLMQDLLTGKVRVQVDEADEVGHDGGI